jgi:hypothetical protein
VVLPERFSRVAPGRHFGPSAAGSAFPNHDESIDEIRSGTHLANALREAAQKGQRESAKGSSTVKLRSPESGRWTS